MSKITIVENFKLYRLCNLKKACKIKQNNMKYNVWYIEKEKKKIIDIIEYR